MYLLKNVGVHFFIRTTRKATNGTVPIYLRLIGDNQRLVISTNRKALPQKWNDTHERVIGNDELSLATNQYLELIKARVYEIINLYAIQKKAYTLYTIKDLIFEKDNFIEEMTLMKAMHQHNKEVKSLVKVKFCYKTYQSYLTTEGFLKLFLKKVYKRNDIFLEEIDVTFAKKFENWILLNTKSKNNGMAKHIQRLKKIINWSIKEGWIDSNPIQSFRITFHKHERGFLTKHEIASLEKAKPTHKTLIAIQELFLFQIYTGLAFSDMVTLDWQHILYNHEGQDWIIKPRDKTNVLTTVPLLPKAKEILLKRKLTSQQGLIFHVYANQPYNRYLKDLAKEIKLKKRLTSHLARHTFATTITLSNGIPIETVSKMLGHTMISTTQIYSKVTIGKIASDMDKLSNKF